MAEQFSGTEGVGNEFKLNAAHDGLDSTEDSDALGDDLGTDAVSAEDGDGETWAHDGSKVAGRARIGYELFHK